MLDLIIVRHGQSVADNDITICSEDTGVHILRAKGNERIIVCLNGKEHL